MGMDKHWNIPKAIGFLKNSQRGITMENIFEFWHMTHHESIWWSIINTMGQFSKTYFLLLSSPLNTNHLAWARGTKQAGVNYKLALTKGIANDWTTKEFAICLFGDWTPCCYSCWPSTIAEGVQGGVRHSVLQEIWWDMSLDSWMVLGTDFMIWILASPHI